MMRKQHKILLIVAIVLVCAAVVVLCPKIRRLDHTYQAIKVDAYGNQAGTVDMHLTGISSVFLGEHTLHKLTIAPFDGNREIAAKHLSDAQKEFGKDFYRITFAIAGIDPGENWVPPENQPLDTDSWESFSFTCDVSFSPDLKCMMVCIRQELDDSRTYYLISLSGEHTADALMEYFSPQVLPQGN